MGGGRKCEVRPVPLERELRPWSVTCFQGVAGLDGVIERRSCRLLSPPPWPSREAFAPRAADPGSNPAFAVGFFSRSTHTSGVKNLVLWAPGIEGSVPVSVYC